MISPGSSLVALDIGGANLKAAHQSGDVRSVAFELWRHPEQLAFMLERLLAALPLADRVAVTMTAELCDCYSTKAEGVRAVLGAVVSVCHGKSIRVWGTDERFHSVGKVREHPYLAAAANWLALAHVAARFLPDEAGLLIDIGTTTTDLVPIHDGKPVPAGRTDTERLRTGELVYAGVRRTPICALATELAFRDKAFGLAGELFATTLDIYLTLGDLTPDPLDNATADGRPATCEVARDRLARMIGADRETFTHEDAAAFAAAADAVLTARLVEAARRACASTVGQPQAAIVAGSGEFLACRVARQVMAPDAAIVSLSGSWGSVASNAACAYALLTLAVEHDWDLGGLP
jgi:probable H4MPT-linked C1 transfer pathway protein